MTGERSRLLRLDDRALAGECDIDLYKASGAGGQKRNKTSSAVRMRHRSSGLVANASDSRSQAENRRLALARLRTNIALDLREPVAPDQEIAPEVARIVQQGPLGKSSKTRVQVEYLMRLADVLDVLEAHGAALSKAAEQIGVTTANLGKLLRGDDRLVRRVAEMRTRHGLKPLQ